MAFALQARDGVTRAPRLRWAQALRLLAALSGAVVVIALLHALGAHKVALQLRNVGAGFAWMLGAYLVAAALYALPLGLLLPAGVRPGLGGLVAGRLAAVAVNAATPLMGLGGEPARLLWIRATARRDGAAALFVDRGAFLFASALFLAGGALLTALFVPLPTAAVAGLVFAALLAHAVAVALLLLQRRGGCATPLARAVGWFSRRHRPRLEALGRELDHRMRALHLERPGRFVAAVLLHGTGRLAASLEVFAATRLLGLELGAAEVVVLTAAPLAIDLAFSIVPSQLGVHEGATALVTGALGHDPAAGLALVFLQRLRQVVMVAIGFALLGLRRRGEGDEGVAAAGAGEGGRVG